jgi:two-component system nitrate/nitrite sensor histidine kinase NarX
LAREMHDNLAQTLGYINLKASMADSELVLKQTNEARASLLELKRAAQEAYTDVRESIFNLRNAPASGDGLLAVLTNSLAEYRAQCGIEAQLYIADGRLAEFPVEVQVQVNRIIQEALTNVRKHSGASRAEVRFGR